MATAKRTQETLDEIRETLSARQPAEHEAELDIYRRLVSAPS